jgi:hypothetical protein
MTDVWAERPDGLQSTPYITQKGSSNHQLIACSAGLVEVVAMLSQQWQLMQLPSGQQRP